MRLVHCPSKCARKLRHAEAKRVPADEAKTLVGYYIGCPACGASQTLSVTKVNILEEQRGLLVSPVRCDDCDKVFMVLEDEVSVV